MVLKSEEREVDEFTRNSIKVLKGVEQKQCLMV